MLPTLVALSVHLKIHKLVNVMFLLQVHTPDSSRYWIATSYEERQRQGLEPENIDKVRHFNFLLFVIGDRTSKDFLNNRVLGTSTPLSNHNFQRSISIFISEVQ